MNIAEKTAGFTISGDTGTESGVSMSVTIGSQPPLTATTNSQGRWSVSVPPAASYITGTSVAVTVSASKTGFTAPNDETRTLAVDLAAPPTPGYTAPATLQVGVAIIAMIPSDGSGISGYSATGLPSGLSINPATGVISGTPDRAASTTARATVTVTDTARQPGRGVDHVPGGGRGGSDGEPRYGEPRYRRRDRGRSAPGGAEGAYGAVPRDRGRELGTQRQLGYRLAGRYLVRGYGGFRWLRH